MTEMLRILLEDSGYRIVTASDGEQALQLAAEDPPDLVTLDMGLPGSIDGREFLRRLHGDPVTAGVPVVVVTGMRYAPAGDEQVAAVLTKPFDVAELEDIVHGVLGLRPGSGRDQS